MYNCPRLASVRATSAATVWGLNLRAFRCVTAKKSKTSHQDNVAALHRVTLLASLTPKQFAQVANAVHVETFSRNERIITKGETGADKFYMIKEGECLVSNFGAAAANAGEEATDLTLSEDMYFGERALMFDEPRAADVTALTAVTCMTISRAVFKEVLGPLQELLDYNTVSYTHLTLPTICSV